MLLSKLLLLSHSNSFLQLGSCTLLFPRKRSAVEEEASPLFKWQSRAVSPQITAEVQSGSTETNDRVPCRSLEEVFYFLHPRLGDATVLVNG